MHLGSDISHATRRIEHLATQVGVMAAKSDNCYVKKTIGQSDFHAGAWLLTTTAFTVLLFGREDFG